MKRPKSLARLTAELIASELFCSYGPIPANRLVMFWVGRGFGPWWAREAVADKVEQVLKRKLVRKVKA